MLSNAPAVSVLSTAEQHITVRIDLRISIEEFMKGCHSIPFTAIINRTVTNFHKHIFVWKLVFCLFLKGKYPRVGCCIHVCIPQYHTTFVLSGCAIFIPTRDIWIPVVPHPCRSLLLSDFFLNHCNMCSRNTFGGAVKDNAIWRPSSYLTPIYRAVLLLYY